MAKSKEVYKYPSRFGSHKSMVVHDPLNTTESKLIDEDIEIFGIVTENRVVCEDEFGRYITNRNSLDNGLADPNRFHGGRLAKLYEKTVDKK